MELSGFAQNHQNSANDLVIEEEASKFNSPKFLISRGVFQSQPDCVSQPGVGSQSLPRDLRPDPL